MIHRDRSFRRGAAVMRIAVAGLLALTLVLAGPSPAGAQTETTPPATSTDSGPDRDRLRWVGLAGLAVLGYVVYELDRRRPRDARSLLSFGGRKDAGKEPAEGAS